MQIRPFVLVALVCHALAGAGNARSNGRAESTRKQPDPSTLPRLSGLLQALPFTFEPNRGQFDTGIDFIARGRGYDLSLTSTEATLALAGAGGETSRSRARVRMRILGGDVAAVPGGLEPLAGRRHYYVGGDPTKWRTDVPAFGRVRYQGVHPGMDIVYYGTEGRLEYDFILAPGARPATIKLGFEGGDRLHLDAGGDLVIATAAGDVRLRKPQAYQERGGVRSAVTAGYVQHAPDTVGFEIGDYDRRLPLVIDPVVEYATFLGGSGFDEATAIAVDASGHAYITGKTSSPDFPEGATASRHGAGGRSDVFVAKFDPSQSGASSLVYVTIFGGSAEEGGRDIAVDAAGNAYVAGTLESFGMDFPTTPNAFQPTNASFCITAGFASKLSWDGTLAYSTYLCQVGWDGYLTADHIAVDASGSAYVTGSGCSPGFQTTADAWIPGDNGFGSYLSKLNASGSALLYSTCLPGGSPNADGMAVGPPVALDAAGHVYVAGLADLGGPGPGTWVLKLALPSTVLLNDASLGADPAVGIAVDDLENIYVVTQRLHPWIPRDAVLTKLDSGAGYGPAYSVSLGDGIAPRVAVDPARNAYVTWWPMAGTGNIVEKRGPTGAPVYSLPLPGAALLGIAVDAAGNAYVTGRAYDASFSTTANAFDTTCGASGIVCDGGSTDAFLVKLSDNRAPLAVAGAGQTVTADAACVAAVTLDGGGSSDPDGDPLGYSWAGSFGSASGPTPTISLPAGVHTVTLTVDDGRGGTGSDTVVIQVDDRTPPVLTNVPAPVSVPQNLPVTLGMPTATDTCGGVSVTSDAPPVFPLGTTVVIFTATDAANNTATATTTVTVTAVPIASATGLGNVTFASSAGTFGSLAAVAESTLPAAGKPTGVSFDFGFFSWTVTNLLPGQSITVTMTYPTTVATGAVYWKVINGNWIDATSLLGSDDGDDILTLTITDGGLGDADGLANGQISDPGAVGLTSSNSSNVGRMHGSGHIDANRRRHHFEFRARERSDGADRGSLRYEIQGRGHEGERSGRFVSTSVTEVIFSDDPAGRPGRRPLPTVDTVEFAGTGRWNGVAGYSFRARAADLGEPGRGRDTFTLTITGPNGAAVASVSGVLDGGNIQSNRVKH